MAEHSQPVRIDHRPRILEAATGAFLENGFESTSTAEIAKRAKLSKRELYSYFHNKSDILAAVIVELQADIQTQTNLSWSSTGELREVLEQAGLDVLRFFGSERFGKLFRIVAAESFRDPLSSRNFYTLGPAVGRIKTAAFLKRHMTAGNLRTADPLTVADDFLDLIVSSRYLAAVVLGQMQSFPKPQVHVEHAVDIFLTYYAVTEPAQQVQE
jgi:AcrR family transcriptional regulator